ncbi:MAG: DUF4870 domain-containing protein [Desulfobulbia bacterium]
MKNKELSTRIKELRQRKGFSQEELADKTGLSLRTIQRIENGETEPLGDSLRRLAAAFDVDPNELTDWQLKEDNGYLTLLNLSSLSFVIFPLLGVIIPLAIWTIKKDKVRDADKVGKALLNFQITWSIILFIIVLTMILQSVFGVELGLSMYTIMLVGLVIYLYMVLMIIINTVKILNNRQVRYIPAFKFLE